MNLHTFTLYTVTLLPVLLLIIALLWLDSFAIIKRQYLTLAFMWGVCAVFLAPDLYPPILYISIDNLVTAPIVEEFLKGLGILFLIQTKRAVFMIDSILYGAAIGAGFAFMENIAYIDLIPDMSTGTAVMRGVGTAMMHCGAVASTGAILTLLSIHNKNILLYYIPALIPAITLHVIYNSLLLPIPIMLVIITFGITSWIIAMIIYSEKSISAWLDLEINTEIKLLKAMRQGHFTDSKAGQYMLTISKKFSPEKLLDMYCYIQIYLEISLISKRNIILQEADIDIPLDDSLEAKISEFKALQKRIGKTGELALSPIIKQNRLIKWKINRAKTVS